MRYAAAAGWIALLVIPGCAQAPAGSQAPEGPVVVCDTLVDLRLLMADGDRAGALARLPQHPACRVVGRERIGATQNRAMVGGAPFECLTISGEGRCGWVLP